MIRIWQFTRGVTLESFLVYWGLLKIIVPVMIVVELAIRMGFVDIISRWCEPAMNLVGLPAETSIILATNIFVGFYGAAAALVTLAPNLDLTTADMTVLGGMLLFVHALPMEQTIVKKTGVSFLFSTFTRFFAAFFYAWLLYVIFDFFALFEEPATILIAPETEAVDTSWLGWLKSSLLGLFGIFWILLFMISLLRILDVSGVTKKITKILTPGLKLIGIGPNAAPLAMIGILLGLAFGGALILREVQKGQLQPKSIFISMIFMGFCHSLIEDTLLVIAFGGHWSGVLVGRVVISLILIMPISYLILKMPDRLFEKYFFKSSNKAPQKQE